MSLLGRAAGAIKGAVDPGRVTDAEKARALDLVLVLLAREADREMDHEADVLHFGKRALARELLGKVGRMLAYPARGG